MTDDLPARFRTVFDGEYLALVRAAYAVTGDWGLAEDATQDAFVELLVRWRASPATRASAAGCVW
jgi:DNA-directed RNA polymerase specialized sigma24 family protein